jgi:hypothetical protein
MVFRGAKRKWEVGLRSIWSLTLRFRRFISVLLRGTCEYFFVLWKRETEGKLADHQIGLETKVFGIEPGSLRS